MTTTLELSQQAQSVLEASVQLALRQSAGLWSPLHLLATMMDDESGLGSAVSAALHGKVAELRARLASLIDATTQASSQRTTAGSLPSEAEEEIRQLVKTAAEEARLSRAPAVGVEHLLLALAGGDDAAARLLGDLGLTYAQIRTYVDPLLRRSRRWRLPFSIYHNLAAFGRDLTELARRGELDPIVGRDVEINRIIQILTRRVKNNPILVGYAGVGKTAIVEGLAQRIAADHVPHEMRYTRIVSIDLSAIVAGSRVRGQLEERLQGIMQDIERSESEIILFIDEVHNIVGAGASEGGFDFASMIKPALSKGKLRLIGATTPDEYRRYIEPDAALERRFSPVWVAEPTPAESLAILQGLRGRYEAHHQVRITDDALSAAVRLSARYLSGRYLPDKAIDLIDEAAARVSIERGSMPMHLKELHDRVQELDATASNGDAGADSMLRGEYRRQMLTWLGTAKDRRIVTEADVASVVSSMTGIPVGRVLEREADRLLNLEKLLHRRVVGQHRAVELVAQAIRRARAGLSNPHRPIASFIFLGPSGVGKTELARVLAEVLFDDAGALIRLDMSEYMERHNVARLFGAPPGYVGYDEGGQLTELVRRRPYRIILFDEIEKAHPDVFNVLLQILDAGRLTDGHGRVVDFRNTVVIMTSNLGTGDERDVQHLLRDNCGGYDREWLDERVSQALRTTFRAEFRNRIDEIVVFEPLSERQLLQILDLQLAELHTALAVRGLSLRLSVAARRALVEEGFHPAFGARPLARVIHRRIITPLSDRLIRGDCGEGDVVIVGYSRFGYTFRVRRGGSAPGPRPVEPPVSTTIEQAKYRPSVHREAVTEPVVPGGEDIATVVI